MTYDFTSTTNLLVVTQRTESGLYSPQESTYARPSIVLGNDAIYLYDFGIYKTKFKLENIGLIDGVAPTTIADAFDKLKTLIGTSILGDFVPITGTVDGFEVSGAIAYDEAVTVFGEFDLIPRKYVDDAIENTLLEIIENTVSAAATLDISITSVLGYFTFTGTTTIWTAPAIAGNEKKRIVIINQGTGDITLNSNLGANDFWESGVLMNAITIVPGSSVSIYNNGINWSILN